ncbi:hypothetical protein [Shinella zoogloeoides]|uniref:hypothetical protein n=1 Tax=Shinella zoogloeoides TaxID=352475 RepID=UPI00273E0A7C|nr:hypothetical protein [Shinella zoogloeoides]WLR90953.1 hypothetical protein Q9316_00825 [Shinella zoogloeoides]
MRSIIILATATVALSGCMTGPQQIASQKPVTKEVRVAIAEAARNALRDPYSVRDAEISWIMGNATHNYVCVRANSKNGFGGYTGRTGYVVAMSNGRPTGAYENNAWCTRPDIKYERFGELEALKNL